MNSLIIAVAIFCQGINENQKRANCVYDVMACLAKREAEIEYAKELKMPVEKIEKSIRLNNQANCFLVEGGKGGE